MELASAFYVLQAEPMSLLANRRSLMEDHELLDEFVRVEQAEKEVRILVREIHWDGPHTPVSTWVTAHTLAATASESEIESETVRVVEDNDYFLVCHECEERNPRGWMHDGRTCQGCAEANHGVVH